ncbi:hypothetical protein [Caballeronia sp. LjRoot31]|uniref:hypothetical protein n=1 Tax=Caballeronia sp. LjRoot31 TaxID=3342324 RepID=UPI003ECFF1B0
MSALPNFKTELQALQSIAANDGSMSAHAGQASQATAVLKTPRKQIQIVPVLDPAIGVAAIRDRYQKDECDKDATFARWLAQLVFRYQAKPDGTPRLKSFRDGHHWWQHTLQDWADECDCTVKQVRGYLARAEAKGLIEKHQWRAFDGKYRGKTVMHVRLLCAGSAAALNGWPDFRQIRMIRECPNVTCLSSALKGTYKDSKEEALKEEGKPPGDKSNPESKSKPVDASLTTTHASPETASGKSCVLSQKPNQDKSKTESNPSPGSATPPLNPAPKKARTSSYVDDCYRAMREHHPDSFMPFKKAQRANLSSLAVRLHKSGRLQARGTDEHAFLQWVFGIGWFKCALEFEDYWSLENHERVPVKMWPDVQALFGAAGEANLKMAVNLFLNDLEQQQHA